jgi:ATP-dependent DNA helicase RecG
LDEARLESTVYTGAGLVRLLGRMAARPELTSEVSEAIAQLLALWAGFDEADLAERTRIVDESRTILEGFVSIGEVGARPLDLTRRARLSKPSRRDRRPRAEPKVEEKAEPSEETEAASDESTASAPEADESSAPETASPAGDSEPAQEASEAPSVESTEEPLAEPVEEEAPRPFAWLNLPERSPIIKARPPRSIDWNDLSGAAMPLSELGILSDEQSAALDAAGMGTVGSFLSRPPVAHTRVRPAQFGQPSADDEAEVSDADLGTDEDPVMVRGRLTSRQVRLSPHMARYEVHIEARQAGSMRLAWVGARPRGWQQWREGMELAFVGTPTEDDDGWTLFEAEPVGIDGRGSGLVPTYGNDDVDEATMRNVAGSALLHIRGRIRESLPQKLVDTHKLMSLDEALRDAHFPSNKAGRGRSRLAFEELLLLQAGIGWRARTRNRERGISHKVIHTLIGELSAQRQVRLSDSAERVFSEIRRDLNSGHAMVRLLQGEVGTDKHTIAMMASAIVVENKAQVLFVMPDAESAERRFLFSDGLFRSVGHAPALVTGSPSRGQLDAISRGECQVVFGTHEMLRSKTKWKKLGLVIVEERNEYGTVDPARLVENGPNPDLLVITDTPIPSSLTLTVFGEYQMSTVENDYPVRCSASVFTQEQRLDAYAEVRVAVEEGRQAFVVFPVGDAGDLLTPEQALHYASGLQAEALDGVRIGVYCSAMSREDRLRVFDDFRHRRLDVLVATTHIEEAPTLGNAVIVVVEHADHHELARLHRLRGHVGQGAESGQCLLVMSENPSKDAQSRLAQLVAEKDGYKIAEMDLKDRGWAALLGDAAEDAPVFHWADPVLDHQQLLSARDEAFRIVKADPGMRRHRNMVVAVGSRWGEWLGTDFAAIQSDSRKQSADATNKRSGRRRRRRRR